MIVHLRSYDRASFKGRPIKTKKHSSRPLLSSFECLTLSPNTGMEYMCVCSATTRGEPPQPLACNHKSFNTNSNSLWFSSTIYGARGRLPGRLQTFQPWPASPGATCPSWERNGHWRQPLNAQHSQGSLGPGTITYEKWSSAKR